ncbi:chemotaxis protein CheW [Sporolactobacillus shoreae]|nr:chemotaxis protein CheW [Sporolactobacillus shoreae]
MSTDTIDQTALALYSGNLTVGILIDEVSEIIEPVPAAPVPVTHPFFSGLISLRDHILPLILLSGVLESGSNPFVNKEDRKFVIGVTKSGNIAIDIDAVGGTYTFQAEQTSPADQGQSFYSSKIQVEDGELPLLNLEKLAEYIQRQNERIRCEAGMIQNH